ncbi:MAG TPA: hypothetical protein VJ183_19805 [Chloroflexia bacterium]|nr:hypothetical protein [Chloroflexia bacterium]
MSLALLWTALSLPAPTTAKTANLSQQPTGTEAPCRTASSWATVANPGPTGSIAALYSIGVVSSSDVWAVGEQYNYAYGAYQPLVKHWDGTQWAIVPSTNYLGSMRGVTVVASDNIWAVGFRLGYAGSSVLLHWDGVSWTYPSHHITGHANKLFAVAAISANDIYAVGEAASQPLVAHWNGGEWTTVANPAIANSKLNGISIVSGNNIWAVGSSASDSETLIMHYDGAAWTRVASPNVGSYQNVLTSVVTLSATNAWAVGYASNGTTGYQGITLHYDGASWSTVPNGTAGMGNIYLSGVAAASSGDVWAVGRNVTASSTNTFALRYNGSSWAVARTANPGGSISKLLGVVNKAGAVWAVGTADATGGYYNTLIEKYAAGACPGSTP